MTTDALGAELDAADRAAEAHFGECDYCQQLARARLPGYCLTQSLLSAKAERLQGLVYGPDDGPALVDEED